MNKEQWDELLELKAKASLTPKTDYHLTRLEDFISYSSYLKTYSQEEISTLLAQFDELSEQEKQDLLSRATRKTNPAFFHLYREEVEKLQAGRKELSFHERAHLSAGYISTTAGIAWLDLGRVFEARIEIDDNSSPERETRPYAHISYSDIFRSRVETIDIIESVKNNPAAIGHPVIVFAIYHWQRVLHAKRVIERDDKTYRGKWGQALKEFIGGTRELSAAERNLEALSKALVGGAKERALSKEAAFAVKVEVLGLGLEDKDSFLYKAWERLEAKFIDPTDEIEQALSKIEAEIRAYERHPYIDSKGRRTSVEIVMEFLRRKGKKGGRRFVGYDREGNSRRRGWKVLRNAFLAWHFDLSQTVVQEYLEKAARQDVDVDDVYQPSFSSAKTTVYRVWQYLIDSQLVMVREPVSLSESEIEIHGVENALKRAASNVKNEG